MLFWSLYALSCVKRNNFDYQGEMVLLFEIHPAFDHPVKFKAPPSSEMGKAKLNQRQPFASLFAS
jgi:hypothetical protein